MPVASLSLEPAVAPRTASQVTVAICTRNRARLLERAVRSVLPQVNGQGEILIVDNASTDDTAKVAARLAAAAPSVVFCCEDKPGISAARNTALRRARGHYVIFLDDDAVAEPGWLAAYETFLSAPPSERVAVVGGPVTPEYEAPLPRWWSQGANTLDLGDTTRPVPARGGPWGCNIAYRRDAAMRGGMFDSRLGRKEGALGAHEESDLNLRLQEAGYEIWWLPRARIRHRVAAERVRLRWSLRSEFDGGRSKVIVCLGARPGRWRRALWLAIRVSAALVHCALNLVLALVAWPFQKGRVAARALIRAAGIAGFGWQMLLEAGRVTLTQDGSSGFR